MDWWIEEHRAKIGNKAFEIYQRRMRGEIPYEEIDQILIQYGIMPNTRAAEEFMRTWDWNKAIEELRAERKAAIARDAAEKEKKRLGNGVYIGDTFPLLSEVGVQTALVEILGITFEEFTEIIKKSDWALATRTCINAIINVIEESEEGGWEIDAHKHEQRVIDSYGVLRKKHLALAAEANIEEDRIVIPFVKHNSPRYISYSAYGKGGGAERLQEQGYEYVGMRDTWFDQGGDGGTLYILRKPGSNTHSVEIIHRQEKLRIFGSWFGGYDKFKNFMVFIMKRS